MKCLVLLVTAVVFTVNCLDGPEDQESVVKLHHSKGSTKGAGNLAYFDVAQQNGNAQTEIERFDCKPEGDKCQNSAGVAGKCSRRRCRPGWTSIAKACKHKRCTCCVPEIVDCRCGVANIASTRSTGTLPHRETSPKSNRIVGGVSVEPPRKYPWQVASYVGRKFLCGGSIINDRWILTAAHCLGKTVRRLKIRVGEHIRSEKRDDDPVNTKLYTVRRQVLHPDYEKIFDKPVSSADNNDFALLEIYTKIPFNNVIRPVCLPEDDSKDYAGVNATLSGWGVTVPGDRKSLSDVLLEADVRIVNQSDCRSNLDNVPTTQLCTEAIREKSSCNGDSGGPLVVREGNKYIQVGVVSWGATSCNSTGLSNVYARVSKVLDWIRKTTANGKC